MQDLKKRLDSLKKILEEKDFLEGKGLSNEVNIRFFCYKSQEEMIVRYFIEKISEDLDLKCNLKIINLYHIFIDICKDMDILDASPDMEKEDGSKYLLEQLHTAISEKDFIDKIDYESKSIGDVIMITGVGEAFPFIRVHSLLEAMQPYFGEIPIIVMYPGKFDGTTVRLFDELKPNSYYRAFNII